MDNTTKKPVREKPKRPTASSFRPCVGAVAQEDRLQHDLLRPLSRSQRGRGALPRVHGQAEQGHHTVPNGELQRVKTLFKGAFDNEFLPNSIRWGSGVKKISADKVKNSGPEKIFEPGQVLAGPGPPGRVGGSVPSVPGSIPGAFTETPLPGYLGFRTISTS